MTSAAHRIRRLSWLVRTPSQSAAFARRQALRDELESVLLPTLERVFDRYSSGDQVLRIPKLTLHVAADFGTDADLARRIEEQLHAALSTLSRGSVARHDVSIDAPAHVRLDVQQLSVAEHRRELLVGYLRSGRIGWQATSQETAVLVEWLRAEAELLAIQPPGGAGLILGTLETRLAISFRLLQLLMPTTRRELLRRVSLPREEFIAALFQSLQDAEHDDYRKLRLAALLLALREEDLPGMGERSVSEILEGASAASAAAPSSDSGSDIQQSRKEAPKPGASQMIDAAAWRLIAVDRIGGVDVPDLIANDAGLILLHPYLPRLFAATGIVTTASPVLSPASLPRAAALLHWLAAGNDDVFEFELSMSKVLLGLTPDDPLPVSEGLLSDKDRDEGDALLAAASDHWSALGRTSIAGLRASFLQRRGMLRGDDLGWRLRMETKSFDMLLGRLPWSITHVKLPWMNKPIFTDWLTP
ncbi:MAG: hypothetical protein IAF94_12845 [Pirellulaceae bacterium]|nr:hypothetical protein [Pirellulaceae bacterium]